AGVSDLILTQIIDDSSDNAGSPPSLFGSKNSQPTMGNVNGGDSLDGSSGNQVLYGFGGNNTLVGGGNDTLFGGPGTNKFIFGLSAVTAAGETSPSVSTIMDYNQGNQGVIYGYTNEGFNLVNSPFIGGYKGVFVTPNENDTIDVSGIVGSAFD